MKKVIVFAIAAVIAIASQAATLNWSLSGVKDGDGANMSGCVAYLFTTADTTSWSTPTTAEAVKSAIAGGTFTGAGAAASKATGTGGSASVTGLGSFGAGDSVSAFMVIFDGASIAEASNYIITDVKSVAWTSPTGSKSLAFTNVTASGTWTPTSDVPEPTSGLLLLVGGALVALRRKQK